MLCEMTVKMSEREGACDAATREREVLGQPKVTALMCVARLMKCVFGECVDRTGHNMMQDSWGIGLLD